MDPIAEMFSQINNAQSAGRKTVLISHSKMKIAILEILKNFGKLGDFRKLKNDQFEQIEINLNSSSKCEVKKISTPGKRVYAANGQIPLPKTEQGLVIISTNEGMMMGEEARKKGLGGEIIAEVN